jgi:hypothetical protein
MMDDLDDICPPHAFKAAWSTEQTGVMFCQLCGDVRPLNPPTIAAPIEEQVATKESK